MLVPARALILAGVGLFFLPTAATAGATPPEAKGGLAAATEALATGRYEQVSGLVHGLQGAQGDAGGLVAARAALATGRYEEAERRLVALGRRGAGSGEGEARVELGRLYQRTGRHKAAQAIWNGFFDDYEQGRLDRRSARHLTAVGVAARYLGSYQDASDVLRDAVAADPRYAPAHLEWAELFLEKYATAEAERDAQAAIELMPEDAEAHALMARIRMEQEDVPAADQEIARALGRNPRHAGALASAAALALDVDDRAGATALCRRILEINPRDEEAHRLLAAAHLLRGDAAGFAAERAAMLAVTTATGPTASAFFHGVAEVLLKHQRYQEANRLEEEALVRDPSNARALAGLGQNYLRLGEEGRGREALARAFRLDRYNVRTYNLLNLLEEVIPKKYETVTADPFRLRVARAEAQPLVPIVLPLLRAGWKALAARYGVVPAPVQVELYADPRHYAVRTVGLPHLEVQGVTFGRVVTGVSPLGGRFNWGMMLWHELAHVFALEVAHGRVPRWFAEGLAEWETAQHERDWRRHTHAELAEALARRRLLPVVGLNAGFVRARTLSDAMVAYHQAAEVVGFLIRRWGFGQALAALRLYGAGQETRAVIQAVTGLDAAAFDRAFEEDLRARLAMYLGREPVRLRPGDEELERLEAQPVLGGHQGQTEGQGQRQDMLSTAVEQLRRAARFDPESAEPHRRLALLLPRLGRPAEALDELGQAAHLAVHDAALTRQLVAEHARLGRWDKVREFAAMHAWIDPCDAAVRFEAGRAALALRDAQAAVADLELALTCQSLGLSAPAPWAGPGPGPGTVTPTMSTMSTMIKGLLARALAATGEHERARRLAAEVLAADPGNADAAAIKAAH